MPDLLWDDVKECFDPDATGTLPDLRVPHTSADDWQALLDLVVERGWNHEYMEGATELPLPRAADVLTRPLDAECPQLRVRPAEDMLAIFRFLADEEIDFDMDLRELQGQERLDLFCDFLRTVGRRLGKSVFMDPEGACGHPFLKFDAGLGKVVFLGER
ncbi:hypothetical protein ACWD3I_05360 [Streptomyces sp. NPDC002817]|uniref:hypothetical protein n=1 Tax=Streptomyces sp. NPDC088357 TaxID=3154655 RepID=UPI00341229EA